MCSFWSVGHEQCAQWDDALSTSALHVMLNEEDCCCLPLSERGQPQRLLTCSKIALGHFSSLFDCSKITWSAALSDCCAGVHLKFRVILLLRSSFVSCLLAADGWMDGRQARF